MKLLTASFNCSFLKFLLLFIVAKFCIFIFACSSIIATVTFSTSFLLLEEIYFLTGYFLLYNIDSSVLFGWLNIAFMLSLFICVLCPALSISSGVYDA